MEILHLLLLFCSILLLTHADNAKSEPKDQGTTTAPNTTVQPLAYSPICEKCTCRNETKTLDCSNKGFKTWPSAKEWSLINNTFETLNFSQNSFELVQVFPNITVKVLILCHNKINQFERGAFKNLQQVVSIDLSHNNLTSQSLKPEVFEGNYSPDFFEPIPRLRALDLSYNDLHTLDQDLFEHMPALENLTISHNEFKVIDHQTTVALSSIQFLKVIDMSYIQISDLPETIFHAPRNLASLNIKWNLLKKIPAALTHAINLEELQLDDNPIEDMLRENLFPLLPKLKSLSMTNITALKKIGKGALSGLTGLTELNMDGCLHLEDIHADAFSRPGVNGRLEYPLVKTFNLRRNNLSSLDHTLLGTWEQVDLRIADNNWDCECQNEWLIYDQYPILRAVDLNSSLLITCASPAPLRNISFENIYQDYRMLRCPDKYGNHPENDGRLLMGLLVGLLLGIPIAMGFVLIYKRGCFGLFNTYRYEHSRALYKRASYHEDF